MQTRKLGFTDLHLTEIGFGAWALGGGGWRFGWGPQDDDESVAAIHRALDLGVNWIDTAAAYGLGHSEEVVAQALEGIADKPIVATKCSLVWGESRELSSSLHADSVARECEASLRRLHADCIDLYQIHWPSDDEHIEEGWGAIARMIEQGKIRYGGVSNFRLSHLKRAQAIHPIASLQPPYSLMRRAYETDGEFAWCREHQVGIVAYSPMQSGLLTGTFDVSRLAPDDWRRKSSEFNPPNYALNMALVERLRPIAAKYGKTVGQLAIAWTLRCPDVTSAIVGARRPSQVDEIVGGAGWSIEADDLQTIDALVKARAAKLKAAT